jgi:uncharacterized protein
VSKVALLDVNFLVALFEPDHVHHDIAHDWFAENRMSGWATCPVTETGLIRVLASSRLREGGVATSKLADLLRGFRAGKFFEWWDTGVSLTDQRLFNLAAIRGHRQVTDIYLAGLAQSRGGKLVTFDRTILWSAIVGAKPSLVEVVSAADE